VDSQQDDPDKAREHRPQRALKRAVALEGAGTHGFVALAIRECRLQEVEVVLELWRQAEATPGVTDTANALQRAIAESPAIVLLAEVQGRVVASIIGTFDGWRGNIYRLAVHPDYRRQGIARALVAEVEQRLTQQGAKRITALVETNHPWAMSFWEAVGYPVDERVVRRVRNL
jgi:ribosomal protein S18 acetylase RimI-like enzyme